MTHTDPTTHAASNTGKVWLVGAGPGDPELLTLKAVRALQSADVILVDDLAGEEVLVHARADARIVHVGKRGGCQSTPQAFIERLMIAEARAGRQVVRLKGGDPFIFGRGGEECLALRDAGITHEVVNGITAGLAAPTRIGVPLTHRDYCHGAILVTGHAAEDEQGPDWSALVATGLPLVVYMGMTRAANIRNALLAAGARPNLPVAVIENATRSSERSLVSTLARFVEDAQAQNLGSPAILVIGETVALAQAQLQPAALPVVTNASPMVSPIKQAAF
jgi:uroporphyrin-III C-methyltransferase